MPLQNRVTPTGELILTSARGTLMGNRGIIHDPDTRSLLTRRWQHHAWVCCRLEFKGYQHPIMGRGSYTELFFLDEATALAAGHRPCAYCRRTDFNAFKLAWLRGNQIEQDGFVSINGIDRQLHRDRVDRQRRQVRYRASLQTLPFGAMIQTGGRVFLVRDNDLSGWTRRGYDTIVAKLPGMVTVLTPRSTVAALTVGYRPTPHPSGL